MLNRFISLGLSFFVGSIAVVEVAAAATGEEAIASTISTELINREPLPPEEEQEQAAAIESDERYRGSGRLESGELVAGAAIEPTFDPPRGSAPRETRGGASRAGEQLEDSNGEVSNSANAVQG